MEQRIGNLVLIEGDPTRRELLARDLRSAGHVVRPAARGELGSKLVDEETDLVILDVHLPDGDGHEVCRRIKGDERTRGTLVLELAATGGSRQTRASSLRDGADGYLAGPIDTDELLATVEALLRLRVAERAHDALSGRLRASETLYRTMTDAVTVALFLVGEDGTCSFMNPAARRLTAHAGEPSAFDLPAALGVDTFPDHATTEQEGRLALAERVIPVSWSSVPHAASDSTLVEVKDITSTKGAETERELFLAVLGHDLRNPLNAISLSANMLQHPTDPVRAAGYIHRILGSVRKMAALIDHLLEFARARSDGLQLRYRALSLSEVAAAAVRSIEATHPTARIVLRCEGDVGGTWDGDRLEQVLVNLLGNACDHGDPTRPTTVVLADRGADVSIIVHNWGEPIPACTQPILFEPFRRASSRAGGLGLGLHIAKMIVRAHGGNIQVHSEAASGTTFSVLLPRHASYPREQRPSEA